MVGCTSVTRLMSRMDGDWGHLTRMRLTGSSCVRTSVIWRLSQRTTRIAVMSPQRRGHMWDGDIGSAVAIPQHHFRR